MLFNEKKRESLYINWLLLVLCSHWRPQIMLAWQVNGIVLLHYFQADIQAVKKGKGKLGERMEKAADVLMGCFRVCASDKYVTLIWTMPWDVGVLVHMKVQIEGWAQDYGNSNIFLKPLFRGNLDPFVNNANLGAIAHCLQKEIL